MMRKLPVTFVLVALGLTTTAQYNQGFQDGFDQLIFIENGETRSHGAIGGFSTPQLSHIDLNNDGIDDLFVFDRSNDIIRTFVYAQGEYVYAPQYEKLFPEGLKEFALLRDYDCDGHADIFTYYQAGFRVYRNLGAFPISFTKVTDKIRTNYGTFTTGAFVLAGDVPAIVDVDGDGDLDILTFGTVNAENTIEFHRNLSKDIYTTCDSFEFEVVTQCWGNIEEPANSSSLNAITCKGVVKPGVRENMHPGSSILLIDPDDDGDKDLVVGDIQTNKVVFAINMGDANSATIDVNQQTSDFPNATDPVEMQYLVSGYELDIDHDGRLDLVMTVNNSIDSSVNTGHLWYYNNTSSGAANYVLQTKSFLLQDMLDLGSNTSPGAMDVNGDGLTDLLISNDYRRTPTGNTNSRIYYFARQSNGTYILQNSDFAGISAYGFKSVRIALGDMDGDGDTDMLLGDINGDLHYFSNNPIGNTANFTLTEPMYMGINTIGTNAAPEIADVNADGLPDLLVGERTGIISYFENTGSINNPQFSSSPTIANFGGIDVSQACCVGNADPHWIDIPALGNEKYLLVGSDEKRADFFAIPSQLSGTFPRIDSLVLNAGRLSPLITDLDGDGIYELLCGTAEGGLKFYVRNENILIGMEPVRQLGQFEFEAYPVPAEDELNVVFNRPIAGSMVISDLSGRPVAGYEFSLTERLKVNVRSLKQGVYLIQIATPGASGTRRFVVLR